MHGVTLSRRQVRELLEGHGLAPSRALGQNFVIDDNTVRRIARLSGVGPGDAVIEIGAGLGALTLALVETGAHVVAVEVDRGLVPLLRGEVESHGVRVVEADALTLDWTDLLDTTAPPSDATTPGPTPWAMVANLPYNVAVPVVLRALDDAPALRSMLVMVQREVGERLAAGPGDKAYGAVSVKVAYHATARLVGRVPASVFVPRPAVESALVRIERRPVVAVDPAAVSPARLFELVRAGFGHRRKMLRQSLAGVVPPEAFTAAGIDPEARAENLSVEDWGRLAACAPGPFTS
jgi:16S rRNA (adenine1518-N6/adenine1519-N6)-dimethyltransferase